MFNRNTVLLAAVAALGVVRAQDTSSAEVSNSESATASASASSSAANATTTVAPISTAMIPTNISSSCSSFLDTLNSDQQFTSCMAPLANITSLYNPVVAAGDSSSNGSTASTVTSTLTQLCASSTGCSDSLIRSYLSTFYSACSAELTDPNAYSKDVREIYDFLYVVNPFKGAVCSKNSGTQRYCVLEIAANAVANSSVPAPVSVGVNSTVDGANSTTGIVATFKNFAVTQDLFRPQVALAAANLVIVQTANTANTLTRRFLSRFTARAENDDDQSTIITPNTTTYLTTGIAYLFLQPNMSSSLLCTTCTKSILASYVAWETQVPYALGLSSSPILGKQGALWNSVSSTCGTNFTDSITAQAGVQTNSTGGNGSGISAASSTFSASTGLVGVVGAMVVGLAALL